MRRIVCRMLCLGAAVASFSLHSAVGDTEVGDDDDASIDLWLNTVEATDPSIDVASAEFYNPWYHDIILHTGVGFRGNVFRSSARSQDAWVHLLGIEGLWLYHDLEDRQWTLFMSADAQRYPEVQDARDEILAFAATEWEQPVFGDWRGSLGTTFFYSQQPFDIAHADLEASVETIAIRSIKIETALKRSFSKALQTELQISAERAYHHSASEDYTSASSLVMLRWTPIRKPWSIESGIAFSSRWFDTRTPRTRSGSVVPGKSLRYLTPSAYIEGKWKPSSDSPLQTRVRFARLVRFDNGADYFNYARNSLSFSQELSTDHFMLRGIISNLSYRYSVQAVSDSDVRPHQWDEWNVEILGDWYLSDRSTIRVTALWERLKSRRIEERYRSRFISIAFRLEI